MKMFKNFFSGQISQSYLRVQQNILSSLNATRTLHSSQYRLRKILKHHISSDDQSSEQQSLEEELNQSPVLLIQKILAKATQPSPLKPGFSLEEMQLAALNLSQFLAAEGNLENTSSSGISNDKIAIKTPTKEDAVTPNTECSVKSGFSEKSHKRKKCETQKECPPNPNIGQIVEMGFAKKSVENAIKALGNSF